MSKHINKEHIRSFSRKALAAALAASTCLYLTAMPAVSAFADEVPSEISEDEDKEKKSVKESASETPVTESEKKSEETPQTEPEKEPES